MLGALLYFVRTIMFKCDEHSLCGPSNELCTAFYLVQWLAVAVKVKSRTSEVCCKACCAAQCSGWWCGLLGPRPRGGMCRTPPTLLYSTPLTCKYFQITSGLRSGLRSGLPFSSLVWSWRWQTFSGLVWCTLAWSAFKSIYTLPGLI